MRMKNNFVSAFKHCARKATKLHIESTQTKIRPRVLILTRIHVCWRIHHIEVLYNRCFTYKAFLSSNAAARDKKQRKLGNQARQEEPTKTASTDEYRKNQRKQEEPTKTARTNEDRKNRRRQEEPMKTARTNEHSKNQQR